MLILDLALLGLHLLVSCPGPGLLLIRRLRLTPLERLCVAVALSLTLTGTASFLIFAFGLPTSARALQSAVLLAMTLLALGDLRRLLRRQRVRDVAGGFAFLLLWTIAFLCVVRNYSGGAWYGDWAEHYQRVLFFLGALPPDFLFLERYVVTTRPPLMNTLVAQLLWPIAPSFEAFQVASSLLNASVFLPCCLLLQRLARRPRRSALVVLTGLLALNPMFMQNVTYSWTKLLAASFVLLALACYLRALRRPGHARIAIAIASLAAACMVHWTAGPYAFLIGIHAATSWALRPDRRIRQILAGATIAIAIALPWFAWTTWVYGPAAAFGSTPTSLDARGLSALQIVAAALANSWSTLVPHALRLPFDQWDAPNRWVALRDAAFMMYLPNLFLLMGSVGGVSATALAIAGLARSATTQRLEQVWFWVPLVLGAIAFGVAVVIVYEPHGTAHMCLLPLGMTGIALLAARFHELARPWRVALLLGCAADFALGILLHFQVQHGVLGVTAGEDGWDVLNAAGLNAAGVGNWTLKTTLGVSLLGDHAAVAAHAILWLSIPIALGLLYAMDRAGMPRPSGPRSG